jgi:hypothetical protein
MVLELLRHFEGSDAYEASYNKPNRWPVPNHAGPILAAGHHRPGLSVACTFSLKSYLNASLSPEPPNLPMTYVI